MSYLLKASGDHGPYFMIIISVSAIFFVKYLFYHMIHNILPSDIFEKYFEFELRKKILSSWIWLGLGVLQTIELVLILLNIIVIDDKFIFYACFAAFIVSLTFSVFNIYPVKKRHNELKNLI